ncbi:PEP-CTERM sorting domain-containing protein [Nostoc sp.]|uniref:PEP-CTERM sorting domain-containing protein n=1 Tax=Nostoc sp. TaxID=1180 RepID=UPI002FF74FDA
MYKKLLAATTISAVACFASLSPAQAVTLVSFSIEPSTPNPAAIALCKGIFDCSGLPGTLTANLSVPATTATGFRLNDTGFDRTAVLYTIADPTNFAFDPVGSSSSIFSNIQVLNNGSQLLFTDGANPAGQYYSVTRSFSTQSNAKFAFSTAETFTSAAVPEPTTISGALLAGALATVLKRKKYN